MPSELEELVEFLHHGNSQIRQIACENLLGYSTTNPDIFKRHQLLPVRDLKLLVRDYAPIAKNAIIILVNLSHDENVVNTLAEDDAFLETLLKKITETKESFSNELCMLLANLAKSPSLDRLITLARSIPLGNPPVSSSTNAVDQLMDCFVKEITNKPAKDYDYLSYVFADLSRLEAGRKYFLTRQAYDDIVPITKLTVFTDEHRSHVRRKGVASTLKNVCFEASAHQFLLSESGANILPYVLLPLAGNEELSDEDTEGMLPDLQLLPPDKERDSDPDILVTHLETLLLLTTGREGRDIMRRAKIYPIIRDCHLHVEDENVREACDRLVQVLLRDEADDGVKEAAGDQAGTQEEDEDEKIVEVF
ncbi:hypothetical protein EPUS_02215 [Endocarpon pusillum Z07020]|uniref:Protein HGH1 homolog n=1 Tax=Endocarpon pusillum (strain Z07020 / HMAS-L-300199) TaxID=1263415 RepID=U1GX58_ENDPU|nr:uncharacterized protein EPUS_02215 [Endocarpon pusillum Z07020]ERF76676.1 hypothetical protein EPUS_02215 [Endocarpon pusillum Z07020]